MLEGIPDVQLQWILDRSEPMDHEEGEVTYRTGDVMDTMWLLVEGAISLYMDIKGRLVYYITFSHDPPFLGVGGALPYSRLDKSPGWSYVQYPVRGISLHKSHFKELEEVSPELMQRLITSMIERARFFATRKLQEEKISALSKLSAGLAHELNNPAAALQRTATELDARLKNNYQLTSQFFEVEVPAKEVKHIYELMLKKANKPRERKQGLLAKIAQEEELTEKLESYNYPDAPALAEIMNEAGIDLETLEEIHEELPAKLFVPVMMWLNNILISSRAIQEVSDASKRISDLVTAMKSHVRMDRSTAMEPVDISKGLSDTLTLLNHKIEKKNIKVDRQYDESLPKVMGYGGELNQVWSNLVDNAIDAMDQHGNLAVSASREHHMVKVSVIDNGAGIPPDIKNQIFDPFFTTKKQGEGTGIGLDVVKQIVTRHHGEVKVFSEPGRTEFQVYLPIAPPEKDTDDPQRPTP